MSPARIFLLLIALILPSAAFANEAGAILPDLTGTIWGIAALAIFILAYTFVILEEKLHMRKSKPVILGAGLIWVLVALAYKEAGLTSAEAQLEHNLLEFAELLLFLLAAMTFINTMEERKVFDALQGWLISKNLSYYWIFWITGLLAFFISPVADNLTTALFMSSVVIAVAGGKQAMGSNPQIKNFVIVSCISIVVAANAGGAFSPFGDITTLMVWQKGIVQFHEFFSLFLPALVNWLVPAFLMSFTVSKNVPPALETKVEILRGGITVIMIFLATIATAVIFHNFLQLPPALGMMTGLGVLKMYGYYLKMTDHNRTNDTSESAIGRFDIYKQFQRAEWDTLMFFYGVILCVGGLGALGYLEGMSKIIYGDFGPTVANISIGIISAIVDNIPVMFAVLSMHPEMSPGQWLLVTLTAGVGGSLLSIGSAAGVGLMGQARGIYTFFAHLKWTWAIALGYALSIGVHVLLHEM